MFGFKFLSVAAISTFSVGIHASKALDVRTTQPLPSCTNTTDFVYAGCFLDPSSPSALIYRTNIPGIMTVGICVDFCKGNGYKYAGLEYYGECFCGASVNGNQTVETDCSFPCIGNQSETCGGNDIISVYQDTSFPVVDQTVISDYLPMGCYSDLGPNGRTLPWKQNQIPAASMTNEVCLNACKEGGYAFGGTEYSQECWCGVVLGNGTTKVEDSNCQMTCKGDSTELCGGSGTINLFVAKDLESTEPCGSNGTFSASPSSSSASSVQSTTTVSVSSPISTISTTASSSSSSIIVVSSSSSLSSPSATSSCVSSRVSSSSVISVSKPPSSSTTTPVTSASLCTYTTTSTPSPACEYKCGNWCSKPLAPFADKNTCLTAVGACANQLVSCLLEAGFPASLQCFQFSSWCQNVQSFCSGYCPGNSCSVSSCKSRYPPTGPAAPALSYSTSVGACSTSTATPTSSTLVPVPTCSNICAQPNNPIKGYSSSSPVGGIPIPCLTCNNLQSTFNAGYPFKLYTTGDTTQCNKYQKTQCSKGCQDACDSQYSACVNTYAQSCTSNNFFSGKDTYALALIKCQNQKADCYATNSQVSASTRCSSFNSGW